MLVPICSMSPSVDWVLICSLALAIGIQPTNLRRLRLLSAAALPIYRLIEIDRACRQMRSWSSANKVVATEYAYIYHDVECDRVDLALVCTLRMRCIISFTWRCIYRCVPCQDAAPLPRPLRVKGAHPNPNPNPNTTPSPSPNQRCSP